MDPLSEGEFLHRDNDIERSIMASFAQANNQPLHVIEQLLQQQRLLSQQPRGILKGKQLIKSDFV